MYRSERDCIKHLGSRLFMFRTCIIRQHNTIVKIPVLSISLFSAESGQTSKQKSSLFYQQSLGMIQTHVPNFLKTPYSLDDKIRTTVQLITYTVLQNCLSLFTIHIQNCSIFVHFSSEAELQIFFLRVVT